MTHGTPRPGEAAAGHLAYRADIDGLRAIAILAVIGFHAFPSLFPGGYVGVDVFFVISGFLITTLILAAQSRNRFSVVDFYSRRIRRIFPALILVLLTTYALGWWVLIAHEYKALGKHMAGASAFVTNFVLLSEAGYFDAAALTKPLLHLWSLAIEEQFYLLWPLILILGGKSWRRQLALILAVVALSFSLNVHQVAADATVAFYGPHTRIWELAFGSLLSLLNFYNATPRPMTRLFRSLLSWAGLGLIAVAVVVLSKADSFPGWRAALPTLGTGLVIAAGSGAWINRRILSHGVLVRVGLISFPLYLWHWPLLSLARIIEGDVPSRATRLAIVAASFLLAWATTRLVEQPIRFGPAPKAKTALLVLALAATGLIGLFSFALDGIHIREAARLQPVNEGDIGQDEFFRHVHTHFHPCLPARFRKLNFGWDGFVACYQSKQDAPAEVAIVGDSHAEHLFPGLAEAAPRTNVVYYNGSVAPYMGNPFFDDIFRHVIADRTIRTVIIAAFWQGRFAGDGKLAAGLDVTVAALTAAGKRVYIIDNVPNFPFDVEICKFTRPLLGKTVCGFDTRVTQAPQPYAPVFAKLAHDYPGLTILRPAQYLCGPDECRMAMDGTLFYRDANHLNINGSRFVGRRLADDHPEMLDGR